MTRNWGKAVVAGLAGTAVMTAVAMYGAPMMGMPVMSVPAMLAGQMGGNMMIGWAAHFMIGTTLAVIYAVVAPSLPGAPALRGALFSVAPWSVAMLMMMPMMGMGLFGGDMTSAIGSLIGHLFFGATVGLIYGKPEAA